MSARIPLRATPYRRENSGGTARDVVLTLGAVEAAGQPDAGSRSPKGPFTVASSTRVSFFRSPPVPRAVPPSRLAAREREEMRDAWKR